MKKLSILIYLVYAALTFYLFMRWLSGLPMLDWMTPVITILGFGFALVHGAGQYGWRKILIFAAVSFVVSLAFESIGVATGKIYGPYHYSASLGPKFLGLVPLLIPLAWFMMIYPGWVMAGKLVGGSRLGGWRIPVTAAVGGMIVTAWDLVMDPVMVSAGHWVWDGPASTRAYFGIPLQNFLGWWLTCAAVYLVFNFITRSAPAGRSKSEAGLPALMYATVGFSSLLSAGLSGLPGPVMVGLMAMAPWVLAVVL
jgi:putative membrane protein